MAEKTYFIQNEYLNSYEWKKVSSIGDTLYDHIATPSIKKEIDAYNRLNETSTKIQTIILRKAETLGFKNESKGLFANYSNSRLRPDFYLSVDNTGIIIEVERGKTNQNNMDFLDFWKCHICEYAHYLILFVPIVLQQGKKSYPYKTVISHMSTFFEEKNYTNVRGLIVIGY